MIKNTRIFLAVFCVILAPICVDAASYYVSSTAGSDSYSGTSTAYPFRTIQRAAGVVAASDIVYIMGGTYAESISCSRSGTSSSRITFRNYNSSEVTISGGGTTSQISFNISGSYITLDGLTFSVANPCRSRADSFNINITGNYVTVQNCDFYNPSGASAEFNSPCNGRETGIGIAGADYAYIYNNWFYGLSFNGIRIMDGGTPSLRWSIVGNIFFDYAANGVSVMSSSSVMQGGLVQGNYFTNSLRSDAIQFNGDFVGSTPPSNWGIVIKNNFINAIQGENTIDLKDSRYIVIENNILSGSVGDNDGPYDGVNVLQGPSGISCGSTDTATDVIIRGNVIYDCLGGIAPRAAFRIYNNTILNNDRDYTGPNSTLTYSARPYSGVSFYSNDVRIFNNIFGGHRGCELRPVVASSSLTYFDYNLYAQDLGATRWCSDLNENLITYTSLTSWRSWLNSVSISGKEAHSLSGYAAFVDVPSNVYGSYVSHDFSIGASSSARDNGGPVATATNSGSAARSLNVSDGVAFSDGMSAVAGDMIMIGSAVARVSSKSGNTLALDRNTTWSSGARVVWCPEYSCPSDGQIDIGARQYGAASVPVDPEEPEPDPTNIFSFGGPSGTLPIGTTTATLYVSTSNNSTVRYATSPGVAYASMSPMITTGTTYHEHPLTGMADGGTYTYYLKALDSYGATTSSSDYVITFSVGESSVSTNLFNATTFTSDSGGVHELYPVSNIWDDSVSSMSGSNTVSTVDFYFDLGALYDLSTARIYGDNVGNWVSTNWSIYYRSTASGAWSNAFLSQGCNGQQWYYQDLTGITARYIRVSVYGSDYPAVEVKELQLIGAISGDDTPVEPEISGRRRSRIRLQRAASKIIRARY